MVKNLRSILDSCQEQHQNFVIEEINDHCLRFAVMENKTYPWHAHPDSDELFLVFEGRLRIELEDRDPVILEPGEFFKVEKGTVHRTVAEGRSANLCFESLSAKTIFKDNDI